MKKIIDKIVQKLIDENVITDEERYMYEYCIDSMLQIVIYIVLIILIGAFTGKIYESAFFLIFFLNIRLFAGGFHADKDKNCFLLSVTSYLIYIIVNEIIRHFNRTNVFVGTIILGIIIILFAPVDCNNRRLIKDEKIRNKIITSGIIFIMLIINVLGYFNILNIELSLTFSCCLIETITLLLGIIKNYLQKVDNRDENERCNM